MVYIIIINGFNLLFQLYMFTGFRLHAVERLMESSSLTQENPIDPNGDLTSYRNYQNIFSRNYVSVTNFRNISTHAINLNNDVPFLHNRNRMNPMILFMQHVNMSMITRDIMETYQGRKIDNSKKIDTSRLKYFIIVEFS